MILLSTGAWGAATHVAQTVRLLAGAGYLPVVLCGENGSGCGTNWQRSPVPPYWAGSTTCRG